MPIKKQLDNLKNGRATRFRSGEEAACFSLLAAIEFIFTHRRWIRWTTKN